uniref:Uncharacterized protein n=1 Tax=Chrysotila carterae TaxID=13221 RepID=A0A7S4FBP1_CHRCT
MPTREVPRARCRALCFRSFASWLRGELPMPCWRTCWEPMRGGDGERRCSAPCPQRPLSALEWRRQWDAALADFWRTTEGAELSRVTSFVVAKPMRDFIWNIY